MGNLFLSDLTHAMQLIMSGQPLTDGDYAMLRDIATAHAHEVAPPQCVCACASACARKCTRLRHMWGCVGLCGHSHVFD